MKEIKRRKILIPNAPIHDKKLSWGAKGVYAMFINAGGINMEHLLKKTKKTADETEKDIRGFVQELIDAGYIDAKEVK